MLFGIMSLNNFDILEPPPSCDDVTYQPNIVSYSIEADYLRDSLLAASPVDTFSQDIDEWQTKPVRSWKAEDIVQWINNEAKTLNICCVEMAGEKFAQYDGIQLLSLSKKCFIEMDNKYGSMLYQKLHNIAESDDSPQYTQLDNGCIKFDSDNSQDDKLQHGNITSLNCKLSNLKIEQESNILGEKNELNESSTPPPPRKKGPGRPKGSKRKKKPEKLGRLWEFIRDLLKNREYCPSLILWENYEERMFRFVHSDKVAKLWGSKKDNPVMNYEKLSRAMRYYYKSQVLLPVIGRRLVYKFGPKATKCEVDNPNFAN